MQVTKESLNLQRPDRESGHSFAPGVICIFRLSHPVFNRRWCLINRWWKLDEQRFEASAWKHINNSWNKLLVGVVATANKKSPRAWAQACACVYTLGLLPASLWKGAEHHLINQGLFGGMCYCRAFLGSNTQTHLGRQPCPPDQQTPLKSISFRAPQDCLRSGNTTPLTICLWDVP